MVVTTFDYPIPLGYERHDFGDVTIYRVRAGRNAFIRFDGSTREAATTIGAFYSGELRAVESSYPEVVGTRYSGFWDFSLPENERHVPRGGWMNCVAEIDTVWFCLHSEGAYKRVSMQPFVGGSDAFVVDGMTFHFGR